MTNHPNRAPRSGHLPGHIRDTFLLAVDAFIASDTGEPLPFVPYEIRYRERLISVAEACRLVWNCTDILPGDIFRELQDCLRTPPVSQTYAAAAQAILNDLRASGTVDAEADIARRQRYDVRDAAWRDLEGWIFAERYEAPHNDHNERLFARTKARLAAQHLVEKWRSGHTLQDETKPIDKLLQAVLLAEDAIKAP